jgi:outer membrane protein insertion porin family
MRNLVFKVFSLFSIFFLNFFFLSNLNAKVLVIKGLSKLDSNDIQSITSEDIFNNNLLKVNINNIVRDLYASPLISDIEVSETSEEFLLFINESKTIQNIFINGNVRVQDDILLNLLSSKIDTLFDKNKILNDINLIKTIYLQQGYKETEIVVSTESFTDERINLIFSIIETRPSKISSVKFIGNSNFSDKYLYSLINLNAHSKFNIFKSGSNLSNDAFDFDKYKLLNFYKDNGFFDVKISYELSNQYSNTYEVFFYIDEGKRYSISEIIYNFDEDDYFNEINIFKNKILKKSFFNKDLIQNHLIDIQNKATLNNNPFLDYAYEVNSNDYEISLIFNELKKSKRIINKVNIYGNKITKDKTLRSKLSFEPGDYENSLTINKSKNDLSRLKYINSVDIRSESVNDKVDLDVYINENIKTGNFLFGGSFSGDTGLGIGLNLKDQNLLGTGNQIDLNISANSEDLLFKIDYSTTPLNNANLTNNYLISNQENDLTDSFGYKTLLRGIGYSLQYKYNENTSFTAGLNYKYQEGFDAATNDSFVTDNIKKTNNLSFNFAANYDDTNDRFYPTKGFKNYIDFLISPPDISDSSFYKFTLKNSFFYEIPNSKNFLFNSNSFGIAESLDSNELNTANTFALGGLNFKGFLYRGIGQKTNNLYLGGNKLFTSTIGYGSSFIFDEKDNINIKLFYTMGSLWDSDYIDNHDFELRSSAGASFDIMTAIGPLSLSYAVPIQKNENDRVKNFTFSIGTSF